MLYLKNSALVNNKKYFLLFFLYPSLCTGFSFDYFSHLDAQAKKQAEQDFMIYQDIVLPVIVLTRASLRLSLLSLKFSYLLITDPDIAIDNLISLQPQAIIGCAGAIIITAFIFSYVNKKLIKNRVADINSKKVN